MAYRSVPSSMTLDDLEGHSPVAGLIKCNSTNIRATFCTVSTDRPVRRRTASRPRWPAAGPMSKRCRIDRRRRRSYPADVARTSY